MKELLEKWAKLEPGRCKQVADYYIVDSRIVYLLRQDTLEIDAGMRIQWAVQQAIVARGWAFELKYNASCPDPRNPYDATVDSNKSGGWGFGNNGFVAPLLEAYLNTLEGETK